MSHRRSRRCATSRDDGFSLIEVLVAVGLFGVVGSLLLGLALSTSRITEDTRSFTNITEQSRLAMERLTRELRQAQDVLGVEFTGTDATAVTFWTDFNGDGSKDLNAADPEVMTYRWRSASDELTLTANDQSGNALTRPVLAVDVTRFVIRLRSSQWQYDVPASGALTRDGITTWEELDRAAPPVGNGNGTLDPLELGRIDLLDIEMTVGRGSDAQRYSTQVDLRNQD